MGFTAYDWLKAACGAVFIVAFAWVVLCVAIVGAQ